MADTFERDVAGISLRETMAARIDMLRLRRPTPDAISQIGLLLGVDLPLTPNRAHGGATRAIWMGPDEWMIVEPQADAEQIETVPGTAATLVVPVEHGRYALELRGPRMREFLAKAVPIDLHPDALPVDHSAMTLFGQIPVVIDHAEPDVFRLWFDVSLQPYVRSWCDDALIEFTLL